MGTQLLTSFPEVKEMARLFRPAGQILVDIGDQRYAERNWYTTPDATFFDIFDFEMIAGDRKTALKEPFSVVITESVSKKYFGNESGIGKTLTTGAGEVKVTGVIKDFPDNSHIKFDVLFSTIRSNQEWADYLNNWERFGAYTYIVLDDESSIDELQNRMPSFMPTYWGESAAALTAHFQPIEDIYLHSEGIESGVDETHGQLSYIYIFSSMAVFLLIIAAINYVNLTTSKSSLRSKEIGIRKVVGAIRKQLILQFLTEALVVASCSMFLSMVVIDLCFPLFNMITGKNFQLSLDTIADYAPTLLIITLLIALMAGSYPAFYLATLKPVASLKGQRVTARGGFDLRTTLVVFQFAITIVLIVSTLVIGDQMKFIQTKDVGFDKEQIMVLDINSRASRTQFEVMKTEYGRIAGVQHVAVSSNVPGEWKVMDEVYIKGTGDTGGTDSLLSYFMGFDEDMTATYQLEMATGEYFSGNNGADSTNVVLNEAAVEALQLTNPVGKRIRIAYDGDEWEFQVIGVLKNFNFQSLHQKVAPMVIGYRINPINVIDYFTLKVSNSNQSLVEAVKKVHLQFDSQTPIEYHFLSEQLDRFYIAEKKTGMIFRMAGALSIVVACLGLLGLAAYHVERRTKELGIRKVLGAAPVQLFLMVSLSFTRNVVIAFVIACPIAWYMMREWLSAFEFRINLSIGTFALAGLFVLLLVLVTVSYQSLKAALFNPINSLKQE